MRGDGCAVLPGQDFVRVPGSTVGWDMRYRTAARLEAPAKSNGRVKKQQWGRYEGEKKTHREKHAVPNAQQTPNDPAS